MGRKSTKRIVSDPFVVKKTQKRATKRLKKRERHKKCDQESLDKEFSSLQPISSLRPHPSVEVKGQASIAETPSSTCPGQVSIADIIKQTEKADISAV